MHAELSLHEPAQFSARISEAHHITALNGWLPPLPPLDGPRASFSGRGVYA